MNNNITEQDLIKAIAFWRKVGVNFYSRNNPGMARQCLGKAYRLEKGCKGYRVGNWRDCWMGK
jgi:hypothetical protein